MPMTTDLPACASPGGTSPLPTLTPAAGAQTGRPVVRCDEWPTPRTLTPATVEIAGTVYPVTLGLDPDCVIGVGTRTCAAVYLADEGDLPTDAIDAVHAAIEVAWEAAQ